MSSKKQNKPLVSIILPSYNHEKYIGGAINSVLNQTYKNWELIIIDDGSVDTSVKIARSFHDERIRVLTQKNHGVTYTLNKGIKISKGDYIAFLDSDDKYHPQKLERQIDEANKGQDLIVTKIQTIDAEGHNVADGIFTDWFNSFEERKFFNKSVYYNLIRRNVLCKSSVMAKKALFDIYGYFDERLITAYDWHLWLKMSSTAKIKRVNQILTFYRWHGENETTKNNLRMKMEVALITADIIREKQGKGWGSELLEATDYVVNSNGLNEIMAALKMYDLKPGNDFIGLLQDEKFKTQASKILAKTQNLKPRKRLHNYFPSFVRSAARLLLPYSVRHKILNFRKNNPKINHAEIIKTIAKNTHSNRKNVVMVVPWLMTGGAERVNLNIMEGLQKDYDFSIFTSGSSSDDWQKQFENLSKNIVKFQELPEPTARNFDKYLEALIRYVGADIVFISNSGLGYDSTPYIRKKIPDIKIVDLLHGVGGASENGGFPNYSLKFDRFIDRRIVITQFLKKYLLDRGIGEDKIEVIPNGIKVGARPKRTFGKALTVGFLGRLAIEKNPVAFIHSYKKFPKNVNIKYVIGGSGPLAVELKDLINREGLGDKVKIIGQVEDENIFFKGIDVLVLPSESEGLPMVILESMKYGVPIVATRVGGIPEMIENNKDGILIENDDRLENNIAEAIMELSEKRSLLPYYSKSGYDRLLKDFDIEKMTGRYKQLFQKMINNSLR